MSDRGFAGGWQGSVLRVDLSRGRVRREPLRAEWARDFLGGRGLGSRYLWAEVDPRVDPFAPSNRLIFATGPLTGTATACAARYMVVTKGPLTGAIAASNSGGHWGPELKFAGYDLLVVEGRSPKPVYLWICDERVELRSAAHLWGATVWETEERVRAETGMPDVVVASIGPAGERRVRFAAVVNDLHRAAGRSGVGAVMGAKNLKAIAVRGTGGVRLADPAGYAAAMWAMRRKLKESPSTSEGLANYGTAGLLNVINEHGALPTRNHRAAAFERAEEISGEALAEKRLVANKACFACTIACGRVSRLPGAAAGRFATVTSPRNWRSAGEGPEYENLWAMGADCGVGDLDAVIKANWLCNDLGMDPISFGATLAAAMELSENGVIGEDETGVPLRFGSAEALLAMAEATAYRRGFGDALAEGAQRLAARYGHPEVFMGVRGQEFPAYDARAVQGIGLAYATSNRGACHLRAYTIGAEVLGVPRRLDPHSTAGKAELARLLQDATCVVDSSGLCVFLTFGAGLEELLPQLVAATGVPYTLEELVRMGERIWNLERMFNERAGVGHGHDSLPQRILAEPIPGGPSAGQVNRLAEMLPEYYRLRGWSPEGIPTSEKLRSLGLAG